MMMITGMTLVMMTTFVDAVIVIVVIHQSDWMVIMMLIDVSNETDCIDYR